MLLHQFIVVLVSIARRFESVLLHLPATVRRVLSRIKLGGSDLQESWTAEPDRD